MAIARRGVRSWLRKIPILREDLYDESGLPAWIVIDTAQ